ncbi:hypothetical protein DPMN_008459 [Dreissena polymorpha]|uniref:Uncharacterized protein n=1 Tax=Dreissena polymorpha TaxID=45954 RepID=A0A9D4MZA5_DREPO|nr:hypothetical protein DPMN_008459 [Dreissena polymorpha]
MRYANSGNYYCCGKAFPDAFNLRRLQRTKDPMMCVQCGRSFSDKNLPVAREKSAKKRDCRTVTSVGWQLGVRLTSKSTTSPTCLTSITYMGSVSKCTVAKQTSLDT